MTISWFYDFNYFYFLIILLSIIRSISLFYSGRSSEDKEIKPLFKKSFIIIGLGLAIWYLISLFLPSIMLINGTESERQIFYNYIFLKYGLPSIIYIFLGLVFLLFFFKNRHFNWGIELYAAILFIIGNILEIINYSSSISNYNVGLGLFILSTCLQLIGILIIFLYSIQSNQLFLIIFSSLFYVELTISLFSLI